MLLPLLAWISLSIITASIFANSPKIVFWKSLVLCLLLSPVIGVIIILRSKKRRYRANRKKLVMVYKKPETTSDLQRLIILKNAGVINEEELEKLKTKIDK